LDANTAKCKLDVRYTDFVLVAIDTCEPNLNTDLIDNVDPHEKASTVDNLRPNCDFRKMLKYDPCLHVVRRERVDPTFVYPNYDKPDAKQNLEKMLVDDPIICNLRSDILDPII
jgi:hypothetical protein